ncbi:MAG: hypothetical protein RL095_1452 [Verrucomicrobiota bacterium]|jgi:23S rRNA pseudouridine955/2504/2580 synthase/23S rRNA pseudouridine1911/1915/1917 synthase
MEFNPDSLRYIRSQYSGEARPLIEFLCSRFTYWPRERWLEALATRISKVNGSPATPDQILQTGDILSLDLEDVPEPPVDLDFRVVHEDDDILVVDKTGDLPVHPAGAFFKNTLWHHLARRIGPHHILTRLDRETSGLVLIARHGVAASRLGRQMERRQIGKIYDALVEGSPAWDRYDASGRIAAGTSGPVRKKFVFTEEADYLALGKLGARTEFAVAARRGAITHLRCTLHTGRTHQIRATLKAIGLPLAGDKIYGLDEGCFVRFIDDALSPEDRDLLRLRRQALHCGSLSFRHPSSQELLQFEAPMPGDMNSLLASLS